MVTTLPWIIDTNVVLDLAAGGLAECFGGMGGRVEMADIAFEELPSYKAHAARAGIDVVELTRDEMDEMGRIMRETPGLSAPDVAGFILARNKRALLLTGDQRLTKYALSGGVQVHGTLWLIRQMWSAGLLSAGDAEGALARMLAQGRRLPEMEVEALRRELRERSVRDFAPRDTYALTARLPRAHSARTPLLPHGATTGSIAIPGTAISAQKRK